MDSSGSLSARRPRPFSRGQRSRPTTSKQSLKTGIDINAEKYNPALAQTQYIQTYKQILHHADLISGGRQQLKSVAKGGQGTSIFRETREKLKLLGAITPRSNRNTSRQQNRKFPNLPPLQITATDSIANDNTNNKMPMPSAASIPLDSIGLKDLDYSDDEDEVDTYNPDSPRAIFLAGCVRHRIPPRSIAMLRKRLSPKLNLAHMSIGNQMAVILSEALEKMPYLQILNISDNNLNDIGLSAIILSAARHGTLEELDISLNVIDDKAADALAEYIGNENCSLKSLRMSGAGIDDKECARFVEVLMRNRCLRELDMSKNLLGKDENLNVVKPDFVTGGEILADLLRDSNCPLQTLNLHWNMIRLEGAEVLCDALRSNTYLTNLDLSYNALGTHAACILGSALLENDCLRILNLANNGIDSIGALTLSVGMRENTSLRHVVLDGNPIGEQGARGMMKAVAQEGHRLLISTLNCDIVTKNANVKLRLDNPVGDYLLCMNHPYDRAIAYEILDIVSNDANYEIAACEIYLSGNDNSATGSAKTGGKFVGKEGGMLENLRFGTEDLGPLVSSFFVDGFDESKSKERIYQGEVLEYDFLEVLSALSEISYHQIESTVCRYDVTHTHVVDVASLSPLLHELLMHDHIDEELSKYKKIRRSLSNLKSISSAAVEDNNDSAIKVFVTAESNTDSGGLNEDDMPLLPPSIPASVGTTPHAAASALVADHDNLPPAMAIEQHPDWIAMDKLLADLADDCQRILDSRASGVIDINLLVEYILQRAKVAKLRCFEIQHIRRCAVRPRSGAASLSEVSMGSDKSIAPSSRPQTGNNSIQKGKIRFHPPAHGWMRLRLIESFDFASKKASQSIDKDKLQQQNGKKRNTADNDFFMDRPGGYTLSRARCMHLITDMKKIAKAQPLTLLQYVLDNCWLRLEEAQLLYSFARNRADDPIAILTSILLRMINTFEAKRMVQFATSDDVLKLRRVKQRLGSAFNPLVGVYTGHYTLDLSNPIDRKCLKSLIEKSSMDNETRRRQGLNDTSQHGHWSCFRNEYYRPGVSGKSAIAAGSSNNTSGAQVTTSAAPAAPATASAPAAPAPTSGKGNTSSDVSDTASVSTTSNASNNNGAESTIVFKADGSAPSIVIVPKLFCPIPLSGMIEFDFVNIRRPTILTCRPVQDSLITDCLLLSRLLENDDVEWALNTLRESRRSNRLTMFPTGAPSYRVGTGRAERIAEQLNILYANIFQRQATRKASQAREGLSSLQNKKKNPSSPKAEKKKTPKNVTGDGMKKLLAVARAATEALDSDNGNNNGEGEAVADDENSKLRSRKNKLRFRSFARQGNRAKHKLNMWEMRMIEIVYGSKGSDEYKASVLLEFFEVELATYWLECRHIVLLLDLFSPLGLTMRSNFGTYRVELLVLLFDRIIDLHNFELIWSVLHAEEHAAVLARIGVLNLFNPSKCEGGWSFSLSRWEEVQVVKMLVHLSVVEPGQNWLNQVFALYKGSAPVPSWELNRAWFTEEGLPKNGQISFEMYAGDGLRLKNCSVNPILRQMLTSLTLVAQRNYVAEVDFMGIDPALSVFASYRASPQHSYHLQPSHPTTAPHQQASFGGKIIGDEFIDDNHAGQHSTSMMNGFSCTINTNADATENHGNTIMNEDVFSVFLNDEQSREQAARLKESRMMQGICHHQRLALYALSHGTGTAEEFLARQRQIQSMDAMLQQEHILHPEFHAVTMTHDMMDAHYHDVAHFTVQDTHEHLEKYTDIKWQYTTSKRPDVWV